MAKEFEFTRNDFKAVQKTVLHIAGINLSDHKFEMVYGRLARRLRATGFRAVSDYLSFIEEDHEEGIQFINAITTNLTYFFREKHHFEFIESKVIDELKVKHQNDKRVRLWSAGCSTGEEPYSLVFTLESFLKDRSSWDIKVLATDLDTEVLKKASIGAYSSDRIESIASEKRRSWFDIQNDHALVKDRFKQYIHFKQLNLMQSWPMKGRFDVIFCRNVLIYFDRQTQQKLIARFRQQLDLGGYLILGHSESIGQEGNYFTPIGKTIFRRKS